MADQLHPQLLHFCFPSDLIHHGPERFTVQLHMQDVAGKLPFQMPRSMEQVKEQREDVPFDIKDPLYPYGYGISFNRNSGG